MDGMKHYLEHMLIRKDLLLYLVTSGLKAQHRNTFLGYIWWLLNPLLGVLIYYFMVAVIFRRGGQDYVLSLVIGLTVWRWLQASLSTATRSIVSQAGIINQVYLPKTLFPIGVVLTQLINFGFGLVVVALFLAAGAKIPGLAIMWLPLLLAVQLLMLTALSLLLAYVAVFVRDMENVINHLLQLWFYGSPVIWTESFIPDSWHWVITINPMAHVLAGYRQVLLHNTAPNVPSLLLIGGGSLLAVMGMIRIYSLHEHRLIKVL